MLAMTRIMRRDAPSMYDRNPRQEHPRCTKVCNACGETLPLAEFDQTKRTKNGRTYVSLYYVCRPCKRKINIDARA
jgi:hypothetical protein